MDQTAVSSITGAIDFAPIIAGIAAIAAAYAIPYIARKGASFVLGMIRGG